MCLAVSCLLSLLLCLVLPAFNGHAAAATRARVSSSTAMTRNIEEENGKLTNLQLILRSFIESYTKYPLLAFEKGP